MQHPIASSACSAPSKTSPAPCLGLVAALALMVILCNLGSSALAQNGTPILTYGTNGEMLVDAGTNLEFFDAVYHPPSAAIISAFQDTSTTPATVHLTVSSVVSPLWWPLATGLETEVGYPIRLAVDDSGGILVATTVRSSPGNLDFQVARISGGAVDPTFGPATSAGVVEVAFDLSALPFDFLADVEVLADGRIALLGAAFHDATAGVDLALAILTADGLLDTSVSHGWGAGKQVIPVGAPVDGVALAEDSSGRLLLAGSAGIPGVDFDRDLALVRLLPSFALDPSFDLDGVILLRYRECVLCSEDSSGFEVIDMVVAADDPYVLAQTRVGGANKAVVTRFTEAGSIDITFGHWLDVPAGEWGGSSATGFRIPKDLTVDEGRGLLVAMANEVGSEPAARRLVVTKLGFDGLPDATFATGGVLHTQSSACASFGPRRPYRITLHDSAAAVSSASIFAPCLKSNSDLAATLVRLHGDSNIFVDGFESGSTTAWTP